jgi:hypothetical protein
MNRVDRHALSGCVRSIRQSFPKLTMRTVQDTAPIDRHDHHRRAPAQHHESDGFERIVDP